MVTLKSLSRAVPLIVLALAFASSAEAQRVSADSMLSHIRYLASDELAGREAGEAGADSAASYIAQRMELYGLHPLGREGYLQPFDITTTLSITPQSELILQTPRVRRMLRLGEEWLPFAFSSPGRVSGPGHAFRPSTGAEVARGDGGDLRGRVAVITPAPSDAAAHGHGSLENTPRFLATQARGRGAPAALVTVSEIESPQRGEPPRAVGIPVAQVIGSEEILGLLSESELLITLDAAVEPVRESTANVVGFVPGRDPVLKDEVIVVGAHYDHLGLGGPGSLAPDSRDVHNGADDNASGTSVVLELSRYFARSERARPKRSIVFVTFSAEEMGLLGAEHFVSHPPVRLERVAAMINFDMVGRLRDGALQIFGTESAAELDTIIDSVAAGTSLSVKKHGDGYGPSDQSAFYARDIPVLHLFTGVHSEYHRPDDDWELINADGLAAIAEFSIGIIRSLGDRPDKLTLVKQAPPERGSGGYGPYLGTIPDFSEIPGGGVRLTGVRAGSPAEKAGLTAGDIIITFGDSRILNLYDYTYALRAHAPGDSVVIRIRRGGQEQELTAVLEQRR